MDQTVSGSNLTLQDRLQLLEEQKKRDAEKLTSHQTIVVEGGGLKDRLKLLETQREKEAAKLATYKTASDAGNISDDLINERLKWMEDQHRQKELQKEAIIIEGGGVKDRLKLLEYQRQQEATRLASKTTTLTEISDDLIRERLRWMDEQAKELASTGGKGKAAIIVEGGNLHERLQLLEEQRRRAKQKTAPDLSHVSDDLIRERLQWLDEEQQKLLDEGGTNKEEIVVEGVSLAERKLLLAEKRRREAESLAIRRLVEISSETVHDRMQWLQQQTQENDGQGNAEQHAIMSNSLIAERLTWLKDSAEKASRLPEKEKLEVTKSLVKQRKEWLDEQMRQARELPPKERIEVSRGLISERMEWLSAAMNRADTMNTDERTKMTSDLIAERLAYLEAQIQANADSEAKQSLEMQIHFLEEKQQQPMTENEQQELANVLITEKIQDLEQQKELISEISDEQQIQVTEALLQDRQAWLEGDQEHYARKREEQRRAQEEEAARALELQETANRIADEVAHSISFWAQQKENAVAMSSPERAQIAAFLIAEHVVSLEIQVEDESVDAETKESVEQQIAFLNDQMENIDDIDHIMIIDVLVQEKVTNLEKMLVN